MAESRSLADVERTGRLVVLAHLETGWIYRDTDGGYYGIDYDLMKGFANSLHVELEVRAVGAFEDLVPSLLAGEGDIIASTFSMTSQRRKQLDFSRAYYPVIVMVVTADGFKPESPAQLVDRTGCILEGSSHQERIEAIASGPVLLETDSKNCLRQVSLGEVDYSLADSTLFIEEIVNYPNLNRAFDLPNPEYYGYAVVPGSDLRLALDDFLKFAHVNGYIYRVIERHQGRDGVELFRWVEEKLKLNR